MRIMLATTPIRPTPTTFPPIGILSVLSHLKRNGIDGAEFYHIDANRPTYEDALTHILAYKPDVLAISSVVSTAYSYTKQLADDIKKALPDTLIVLGGNLAASAEIILNRSSVDICVLGEGEKVFLDVVRRAEATLNPMDFTDIPGLMLLDHEGKLINTGYAEPLDKTEIYDIDWTILEDACDADIYFPIIDDGPEHQMWFSDPDRPRPDLVGKRMASLPGAKGCVAKCTFCHRWDKGIRYIPVDLFMYRLDRLMERYDIGFLAVADENFGTDKRWLKAFCEQIKKYNILWRVGGMRVNCITPEYVEMMKDAGCISIVYGMETGSERMLGVMEKKVKLQDNYNAMNWTVGARLWTAIQLVIGMPGETTSTINETITFCKYGMTLSPEQNPNDTSINYAQALPGTPLYEFGRHKQLIGRDISEEEDYLLRISDKDAHDEISTLNFTDVPTLICQTWRPRITIETNYAYVRKYGLRHYRRMVLRDGAQFKIRRKDAGYFANPKRLIDTSVLAETVNDETECIEIDSEGQVPPLGRLIKQRKLGLALICYPVQAYHVRHLLPVLILLKAGQRNGFGYAMWLVGEYLSMVPRNLAGLGGMLKAYKSLRKVVNDDLGPLAGDSEPMQALRRGR